MPQAIVNYWAVVLVGIMSMVLGMLWYSPALFGKPWSKAMGWANKTKEEMDKMKKESMGAYAISFIGALIMGYVLSHFVDYVGAKTMGAGMQTGFWIWLGFVAPVQLMNVLYGKRPLTLFFIDSGYQLANLMIAGSILAKWM